MDVDTAASLDQLRECNVSHNHAMLVIRNKGSMLFPIYIRFGVIFLSHGNFIRNDSLYLTNIYGKKYVSRIRKLSSTTVIFDGIADVKKKQTYEKQ